MQEQENASHKETLNYMNDSIESLNSRNKLLKSKIDQFKSRNEDLEQRVMKVALYFYFFIKLSTLLLTDCI